MEGAPDPSLGHEGSAGDAICLLDHVPDPCDYIDKKGKKCTEYGEDPNDPEYVPPALKTKVANTGKKNDDYGQLSAKYDQMEVTQSKVQDSVTQLSDDMAKLMKMMATLTKVGPDPKSSLADSAPPPGSVPLGAASNVPASILQQPVTANPHVVTPVPGHPPTVPPAATSAVLADRVNSLISDNSATPQSTPSITGYTGPTIPDLRKDLDLSAIVRAEVQKLIATQLPSLQKSVANQHEQQTYQQQQQLQASNVQQLEDFRAQQKRQMEQFAATQEEQFMSLQQKLGVSASGQHAPPPCRPTNFVPAQSDHPAYTALQSQGSNSNLAMDMETLMGLTVRSKQFRPYEFASRTQLFYAKNITERNCNFPCYVLGYLRHCLILMSGVVPSSENEVSSRLTNIMNICEIAANNSTLNDFDCSGWQIAKAYGDWGQSVP